MRWIWLKKPKMPARFHPYERAEKWTSTTARLPLCLFESVCLPHNWCAIDKICDDVISWIPLAARRLLSARAARGATPVTDTGEAVECLKIKVMDVFTSLHIISLCLNALADASEPLKDQSHLMRIIKDNICTHQSRRTRETNEGCCT